jgi:hypothetical protein
VTLESESLSSVVTCKVDLGVVTSDLVECSDGLDCVGEVWGEAILGGVLELAVNQARVDMSGNFGTAKRVPKLAAGATLCCWISGGICAYRTAGLW